VQAGCTVSIREGSREGRLEVGEKSVSCCNIVFERDYGTITIGGQTYIGGSNLICAERISIGSGVLIAWGCTIVDHDSHSVLWSDRAEDVELWRQGLLYGGIEKAAELKNWGCVPKGAVTIEDKAWIGFNCIILKNVTIGTGAVIAAGSVVAKSIPPWSVAGGNPARVIKELEPECRT
jgi:acetyltransferase-like isoleucine patch superfamily enzyme